MKWLVIIIVWLANGEGNGPGEYTIAMETEAKCQQIVSDMRVELESKGVTMEIKRDCFYWDGTEQQYIEEYGKSRSI